MTFVSAVRPPPFGSRPGLRHGCRDLHLPSVVGLPKAKELLLTTDTVEAEEALAIGLLNRLDTQQGLEQAAGAYAERIAEHPPKATRRVKALLDRTVGAPLQQRFYRELYSNNQDSDAEERRALFESALSPTED